MVFTRSQMENMDTDDLVEELFRLSDVSSKISDLTVKFNDFVSKYDKFIQNCRYQETLIPIY